MTLGPPTNRDEPYGRDYRGARLRLTALDQAIVYLQNRQATPDDVVQVADTFFKFLTDVVS